MKRGISDADFLANYDASLPDKDTRDLEAELRRKMVIDSTKLKYMDETLNMVGVYQRESDFLNKAMKDIDRRQDKFESGTRESFNRTVNLRPRENPVDLAAGLSWLLADYDKLIGPQAIKVAAVGLEYAVQMKSETPHHSKHNNVSKIIITRFRRALSILVPWTESKLPKYAVDALVEALTGYELVGVSAAITIWRLWGLGFGCDMLDATGFSKPFPETALERRLSCELENNAPESIRRQFGISPKTYYYSFNGADLHRPAAHSQSLLLLQWQGLIYYLLNFSPKPCHHSPVYSSMGMAPFDQEREGGEMTNDRRFCPKFPMPRTTPVSSLNDVSARHRTLADLAACETALAFSRYEIIQVEYAEPTVAFWDIGKVSRVEDLEDMVHDLVKVQATEQRNDEEENIFVDPSNLPDKVSCIRFRSRNLKTMPVRSERQMIRIEIKWRRSKSHQEGDQQWKYSTVFGRVIATQATDVYVSFENDGEDPNFFHEYGLAPPIDGKDVVVMEISTVGPSDPTAEEAARYHFLHLASSSIPQLLDPTGLLAAVYPALCLDDADVISHRLRDHLSQSQTLRRRVAITLPPCALVDESQMKVMEIILAPLPPIDSLKALSIDQLLWHVIKFIQGPPGTGKSSTIAHAASQLIATLEKQAVMNREKYDDEKIRLNQQGLALLAGCSKVTELQHEEQNNAFRQTTVNQSEAIFVVNKNNLTTINTHKALEKIGAAHSVLRPALFGAFHEETYLAMEETAIGLRGLREALENKDVERIILCTVGTFQSLPSWFLEARKPSIVIVEEASTLPLNFLPSILYKCGNYHLSRLVFVGDDKQLGPYMAETESAIQSCFQLNRQRVAMNFNGSNEEKEALLEEAMLMTAYRNPAAIAGVLSRERYGGLVLSSAEKTSEARQPFCRFVDMSRQCTRLDEDNQSTFEEGQLERNQLVGTQPDHSAVPFTAAPHPKDVTLACDLLLHYTSLGRSTTVLTMYEQHRFAISCELFTRGAESVISTADKLSTVDGFQGREDDYIILVVGRTGSKAGFVASKERQTVAISRPRLHLTVITSYNFIKDTLRGELLHCLAETDGVEWVTPEDLLKDLQFRKKGKNSMMELDPIEHREDSQPNSEPSPWDKVTTEPSPDSFSENAGARTRQPSPSVPEVSGWD